MNKNIFSRTKYGDLVRVYDFLEYLNFGNISKKSRDYFLGKFPFKAKNPLIAACGTGDFVVEYIRTEKPDALTINDLSTEMLERTKQRIHDLPWDGKLSVLHGDVTMLKQSEAYDFISITYFISMFSPKPRLELLLKIKQLLRDDGLLLIADYMKPHRFIMFPVYYINWFVVCMFFWIFSHTKPNVLGNMERTFEDADLEIVKRKYFIGGLFGAFLLRKR